MKFGNQDLFKPKGNIFFIGDIQGDDSKLLSLWTKLKPQLKAEDHVVFLGDYIGKNNNLKTLILLEKISREHKNSFFILGNHDDCFLTYVNNKDRDYFPPDSESLMIDLIQNNYSGSHDGLLKFIKDNDIKFIFNTIPYYETKKLIATHAPLNWETIRLHSTSEGLLEQLDFDILYDFVEPDEENYPITGIDKWLICGHQNNYAKRKEPSIYRESKRMFLDCGCGYEDSSKLFAVSFPGKTIISS